MPDITLKTISATQSPALFGCSPYLTRWMLHRHFAHGEKLDVPPTERMSWGLLMQPLLLDQAARDLKLEVHPVDNYVRNGQLGCTRDATIICPDRGPGALECKCVFDYGVWMNTWGGGESVPRHYEIQLQQQMLVGDGVNSYGWGVIAVWVCGEMRYYERKPIPDLWDRLNDAAKTFFDDVEHGREPAPFGEPQEADWITSMWPTIKGQVVDFSGRDDANDIINKCSMYKYHKGEASSHDKAASDLRIQLLALMGDNEMALLPEGVSIKVGTRNVAEAVRKAYTSKVLTVKVPEPVAAQVNDAIDGLDEVLHVG
jgi:hypothetical protein